jgi:hypothetical protein
LVTSGQIAERIAQALELPEETVTWFVRVLRDAGLIQKGARGSNARHLTSLEIARILIALLVTDKPSRAIEAVQDFGPLKYSEFVDFTGDQEAELWTNWDLKIGETLEDAVARLLDLFAIDDDDDFDPTSGAWELITREKGLRILMQPDKLKASVIGWSGKAFDFSDPLYVAWEKSLHTKLPPDRTLFDAFEKQSHEMLLNDTFKKKLERYRTRISVARSIHINDLSEIAKCVRKN